MIIIIIIITIRVVHASKEDIKRGFKVWLFRFLTFYLVGQFFKFGSKTFIKKL
jgi:hypothetical protein